MLHCPSPEYAHLELIQVLKLADEVVLQIQYLELGTKLAEQLDFF